MLERTKSYIEQYQRMIRFYNRMKERCEEIYKIDNTNLYSQSASIIGPLIGSNKPAIVHAVGAEEINEVKSKAEELIPEYINKNVVVEESCDMIYAFFQNCYHLKDWITVNRPDLGDKGGKVEQLFTKENQDSRLLCMKVCADLCNGSKHCKIDRTIRIDPNTDVNKITVKSKIDIIKGNPSFSIDYNIQSGDYSFGAVALAGCCIAKWDEFMKNNSLPIS